MKFIKLVLFLLLLPFMVLAQGADPETVQITWQLIVAMVVGFYEVVIRLIPTVQNYSILATIINVLKFISDYLNKEKK